MRQLMKQYYVIIIIILHTHRLSLYVGASVEKKTSDLEMSVI